MTSIRRQLTWKLLAVFAAPLALGGGGAFLIVRHSMLEQFDATLFARAGAIASITEQRGDRVVTRSDTGVLRRFESTRDLDGSNRRDDDDEDDVAFFEMWHVDGTAVARSDSLGRGDLPFPPPNPSSERRRAWDFRLPTGRAARAVSIQFALRLADADPSPGRPVILAVATSRAELDRTLQTVAVVLGGCGAVLLVAATLVVPRVLTRELSPVDRLADQAAAITPDSLETRFSAEAAPTELAPIIGRLNELLDRLQRAFERERQFTGDLAHELRTPVAELRNLAEVAVKWPDSRSAEIDHDTLAIALQLDGIVTRLLALLRSEREQLRVHFQPVQLSEEIATSWRSFAERATQRRLQVSIVGHGETLVESDPILLRSILANLYDNACEYTPEGGSVTVEAEQNASGWCVRVSNDAVDLSPADVSKLFDRFWRRDTARASGEHSGLGLSLAKGFARVIGADLTAHFRGRQLTLTLTGSPAAPRPAERVDPPPSLPVR
jgi:two-component system sensor histidine kinase QseC